MKVCRITGLASWLVPLILMMLLAGCVSSPLHINDLTASLEGQQGVHVGTRSGGGFTLLAIEKLSGSGEARLYVEGDGRPWIGHGRRVSNDPSPRDPYLLPMMLASQGPALYLGRPCYFGLGPKVNCHPALWTFSRYSERVVDAMAEAAEAWLVNLEAGRTVTLVGHSGGGVLALLLTERLPRVDRVIALATPVSLGAWVRHHDYLPLFDSVDPVYRKSWRPGVERHFLYGGDDGVVPAEVFAPLAESLPNARVQVIPGEGHRCCALPDASETWSGTAESHVDQ